MKISIKWKRLWILAPLLVGSVLFVELFLRLEGSRWFYDRDREYTALPFSYHVVGAEPDDLSDPAYHRLIEGRPSKLISMTEEGLRWPPRNREPYGYLAIGSSQTMAGEVDDRIAWPAGTMQALNRKLGEQLVWIGNAGQGGMNTVHNIMHLRQLVPRLNVRGVLFNVGLNDANYFSRHGRLPELHPGPEPDGNEKRIYLESFPLPAIQHMLELDPAENWWQHTYTWQFGEEFGLHIIEQRIWRGIIEPRIPGRSLQARRAALKALPQEEQDRLLRENTAVYAKDLRQLLKEAKAMGLEVIVVGTPSIADDFMLVELNTITRQVSLEEGVMFFDVEALEGEFEWTPPHELTPEELEKYIARKRYLFHDGHHYNNRGSVWLADRLSDFMLQQSPTLKELARSTHAAAGVPQTN